MSLKKSFSKDKTKCTVTFTVSPEAAQGAKTVNIAGDFNSWSSTDTPLKLGKDGAFSVKIDLDVDKEYQNALDNGAKSVLPPTTEPWGQRTCYVADPDGNLIEIGSFTEKLM